MGFVRVLRIVIRQSEWRNNFNFIREQRKGKSNFPALGNGAFIDWSVIVCAFPSTLLP
jgi:hypothetical protein